MNADLHMSTDLKKTKGGNLCVVFGETDIEALSANDPYKALKTTLKAEIDAEARQSLRSDRSRPFKKLKSGRIAVKAINHLGGEVMKVVKVPATDCRNPKQHLPDHRQ